MAFRNIPPNGFPAIPDIEDLEGVEKDVSTLKTTTAGLTEDVSDLEEQKANQITIALSFDPETTYEVGDLVYYNGLIYRCTNEHTGEWDADDFSGTTIANELASVKSGLIKRIRITETTSSAGTIATSIDFGRSVSAMCITGYNYYLNIRESSVGKAVVFAYELADGYQSLKPLLNTEITFDLLYI